jgi:hypothetical protein
MMLEDLMLQLDWIPTPQLEGLENSKHQQTNKTNLSNIFLDNSNMDKVSEESGVDYSIAIFQRCRRRNYFIFYSHSRLFKWIVSSSGQEAGRPAASSYRHYKLALARKRINKSIYEYNETFGGGYLVNV